MPHTTVISGATQTHWQTVRQQLLVVPQNVDLAVMGHLSRPSVFSIHTISSGDIFFRVNLKGVSSEGDKKVGKEVFKLEECALQIQKLYESLVN